MCTHHVLNITYTDTGNGYSIFLISYRHFKFQYHPTLLLSQPFYYFISNDFVTTFKVLYIDPTGTNDTIQFQIFVVEIFCSFCNYIKENFCMNGTIKICQQTLVSLFKYLDSSSLFCNNCHSLCFCSITVTMARAMDHDFSGTLSVDVHPIHVATNKLLSQLVIDSIINLVLDPVPT